MSHSKFNKTFLIATLVALGAIAAVQGCSSSDVQQAPSGGADGKAGSSSGGKGGAGSAGKAGSTTNGDAGETANGGTGNVGPGGDAGTGNSEAGAGGEGGAPSDCDGFLKPCNQGQCDVDFDNSTLTKIKNGVLPPL